MSRLVQERGITEDEASEVAMQSILAPVEGPAMADDPPEPVPWLEREKIVAALDRAT